MTSPTTARTAHAGRNTVVLASLVAVALVAVAFWAGREPAAKANAAVTLQADGSVGVLDFDAMMQRSTYVQGLQSRLQEQGQERLDALRQEAAQLQEEAREAQQALEPGSDQFRQAELDISLRQAQLQVRQQAAQRDVQAAIKQANVELLDAAEVAVRQVAQDRGLALVLRKNIRRLPNADELRGLEVEQLDQLIRGQTVLYNDPSVDITSEVVDRLDRNAGASE